MDASVGGYIFVYFFYNKDNSGRLQDTGGCCYRDYFFIIVYIGFVEQLGKRRDCNQLTIWIDLKTDSKDNLKTI